MNIPSIKIINSILLLILIAVSVIGTVTIKNLNKRERQQREKLQFIAQALQTDNYRQLVEHYTSETRNENRPINKRNPKITPRNKENIISLDSILVEHYSERLEKEPRKSKRIF